ncbi:MAG TPA: amidohydrolase family protein [Candidatus Binataceae bacterium]|nr:amidohydrolase family protein [Candidatus Binataceae bacterium]
MPYDLLIKDARICDGTGAPLYAGAVAVENGKIVLAGAGVSGSARREIDAGGLVVAPGFIDIHTHYDAQVSWDRLLTCSSWHGVTSLLMGNCGVGVAPVRPRQKSTMAWDLVNVEALPHDVLMRGVSWEWESFPEYMAAIERGGIALNTGFLVPLSALRFYVIGDQAAERAATAEETAQMAALLRDAMLAGAYGFSLSLAPQHIGFQGRPLASRMASNQELGALCRVMRELNRGVIEILPSRGATASPSETGFDLLVFLAEQSQRPVTFLALLDLPGIPLSTHVDTVERLKPLLARGLRILPQVTPRPIQQYYTLRDPFIFAALDSWKGVFNRSAEEQMALFRSEAFRIAFKDELKRGHKAVFRGRWDRVHVVRVEKEANRRFLNRSIAQIATELGKDPEDAILDLGLDENLELGITLSVINVNKDIVEKLLQLPNTLIGLSDAGAHVAQHCDAGLPSYLLAEWVRERHTLTLEEGVRRLTSELADFMELRTKGRIRAGNDADLVIFDPDRITAMPPEWVNDLPGGQPRLIERAEGIEYTIVNGEVLFAHNVHEGAMPGRVLRSAAG